ncbi:MAG: 6-bladed beta-propeller [Acidobacteriota bacterium]
MILLALSIFPESVKFLRTVDLGTGSGNGKLTKLLFGKKKTVPVKPSSIFLINEQVIGMTDQINGEVLIAGQKGKIKSRIKKIKRNALVSPVSGCSDGSGGFYVSDSSLKVVAGFSDKFKFRKVLISYQTGRITGISYYRNKLFCTDTDNHKIVIISGNGKIINEFGRRGTGKSEFNFPTHIAVDEDTVYVTDSLNFRIQMFDHKGGFKGMFGKNGKRGGDFSKPKGIAVDSKKRIFVTDVMFDNVQVFDIAGRFLSYFGGPGKGQGQFWMPSGIVIDKNDIIYIADTYNSRLQVFKVVNGEK